MSPRRQRSVPRCWLRLSGAAQLMVGHMHGLSAAVSEPAAWTAVDTSVLVDLHPDVEHSLVCPHHVRNRGIHA